MDRFSRVPVVDESNRFLSYTHPARARKLLRDGVAEVFSDEPFTIRLRRGVEGKMKAITNFTEYFSKERDIYVQNKSDRLISLEFTLEGGMKASHRLARTPDPVNLTQFIPFSAVKNSMDLRSLANRKPPAIVFLDEEDYRAYFENRAKQYRTSIEDEIARSNEKHRAVVSREALKPAVSAKVEPVGDIEADVPEDEAHPRVLGLCVDVGADLPPGEVKPAREFIEELEAIEKDLRAIDYTYLIEHGYHKSVKKWAQKRLDKMTDSVVS